MASRKQPASYQGFIKVISEQLAIDLTAILNHESYDKLRTYGAIAAWFLSETLFAESDAYSPSNDRCKMKNVLPPTLIGLPWRKWLVNPVVRV